MASSAEEWKPVPSKYINNIKYYEASNLGNIRQNINGKILEPQLVALSSYLMKDTEKVFPGIIVGGKPYYVHVLVYSTFNPTKHNVTPESVTIRNAVIGENGMYEFTINDLNHNQSNNICEEFNQKYCVDAYEIDTEYGKVMLNEWYNVKTHKHSNTGDVVEDYTGLYKIKFTNNPDIPCIIKNVLTSKIMKIQNINNDKVLSMKFTKNRKNTEYSLTHIMLMSAFPDKPYLKYVNTIDLDKGPLIDNIKWSNSLSVPKANRGVSKTDNTSAHASASTVSVNENTNGGSNLDKYVKDNNHSNGHSLKLYHTVNGVEHFIGVFPSAESAGQYVHDECMKTDKDFNTKVATISRSFCKINKYKIYTCTFIKDNESQFPNEIWKPLTNYSPKLEISNYGRIKTSHGSIVIGTKNGSSSHRRYYLKPNNSVNKTWKTVHELVWEAFNGEIPDNMRVIFTKFAQKDDEGMYKNRLSDMKLVQK